MIQLEDLHIEVKLHTTDNEQWIHYVHDGQILASITCKLDHDTNKTVMVLFDGLPNASSVITGQTVDMRAFKPDAHIKVRMLDLMENAYRYAVTKVGNMSTEKKG